ncbi:MAG TPA: diaminopimelate decarboxylase, partial [Gemmatimonadaceae bacterium]|nr:diaminopimelate decarboxylase [Gemmatimonadaceae bacterium]
MGQGVLIAGFTRSERDGAMQCEGVPIERITRDVGTPVYIYSSAVIRDRYERLDAMLSAVPHRIHYTLKANPNRAVLRLLRELGAGVDVVSGGELKKALAAGFEGKDIIFGGVGKTEEELRDALAAKVMLINVESDAEIRMLSAIATEMKVNAPVGIRVNPELNLHAAHDYIKTGGKGHKFGIPYDEALDVALNAARLPHIRIVGLDMHLGSQLSRIEPYKIGAERLLELHKGLVEGGVTTVKYLDIGGGLGVRYDDEKPPNLDRFAKLVLPLVASTGLTLVMEPGRFVIGNAGALVGTVLYRKKSGGKDYVVADIGMTELLRPSHYGAFHRIEPVQSASGTTTADIVGPVCESGDFLALDREI